MVTKTEIDWEKAEYSVEKVPVKLIDIGQYQARTKKVEEGLDDLAENIRILGLLNPVTVYRKPDGRYELVAGQRRFMAINDLLHWDTIPAHVLHFEPSDIQAKAISLSENIIRESLAESDIKNSIMLLYTRCGASGKAISDTLGIPYSIVLDIIKYEGLPEKLKRMVDKQEIDVDLAKRATKAALDSESNVDENIAVELVSHMKNMMPEQQKVLIKNVKDRPELTLEENVEDAKKVARTKQIRIIMLWTEYEALGKYAESEGVDEREAAVRVLTKTLKDLGYLA